jgi:hydrogenase nickel incorporation protein HypA/HybF
MHEMAITQSVVDAVCEQAAGRRVRSVKLEVGALCAIVPAADEQECSIRVARRRITF